MTSSTEMIACLADAAQTPLEVRFLNKSNPVKIGELDDKGVNLARLRSQLLVEPSGLTPICKQIGDVIEAVKFMENEIISTGKIVILIIMTDGESTDGDVAEMLKPMEGLPLQIIVRICTDESDVSEYWDDISAKLDIDVRVLDDLEATSSYVDEFNKWITYGEPLHRIREFGIMVPAFDALDDRILTKSEIKTVAEILLNGNGNNPSIFPDPDIAWEEFRCAKSRCSSRRRASPPAPSNSSQKRSR